MGLKILGLKGRQQVVEEPPPGHKERFERVND
jgi:hypothetical protein